MSGRNEPRPYEQWRTKPIDRSEDAAYTFGSHIIRFCRKEALERVADLPEESRSQVVKAVDLALHNVMDLLEGFFRLDVGPNHKVEYELVVCVKEGKGEGEEVERLKISPSLLDLPVGYWKWKDNEFR